MRKVLADGLKAMPKSPRDNDQAAGNYASLFCLGPSDQPHAAYAAEAVLEIEVRGEAFLVPLNLVRAMVATAERKIVEDAMKGR